MSLEEQLRVVKFFFFVIVALLTVKVINIGTSSSAIKDGDLIFQSELLPRGLAIQAVTVSKYNHVGVVFEEAGEFYVYEAIGKVTRTPLKSFINRKGTYGRYTIMRPRQDDIDSHSLKRHIYSHLGKQYDLPLKWTDERMYCSELVWKAYNGSNSIEISTPTSIQDRAVGKILLPLVPKKYVRFLDTDDPVVSPADLARSWKLKVVYTNY